jgi:hypothetical protein
VEKAEEKRPLGKPRRRWEDNIKMDLQKMGLGRGLHLSGSAQGQMTGCCECANEHSGSTKCGRFQTR